jgi:hypothetical protein
LGWQAQLLRSLQGIRFLFVGPRVRSPLLSATTSRWTTFRWARLAVCSGSLRPGSPEDFHLLVTAHAGHTSKRPPPEGPGGGLLRGEDALF